MNRIVVNADLPGSRISKHIYGHFAEHLGRCIYDGFWVGEDSSIPNVHGIRTDVVDALKKIRTPNLRWPGGCFADEYHWRDGIGKRADRPTTVNTHWGGVDESNDFGTHEFMELCAQLDAEPYICGNVGSGTAQEMSQWVEYLTSDSTSTVAEERRANGKEKPWKISFWGVGNENWGCGGMMKPEYYADLYRRYNVYCRNYDGNKLFRIACGANSDDYHWTEVLMREAGRQMDGLSLHYYTQNRWGDDAKIVHATEVDEEGWFEFLLRARHMETLVSRHGAIMDVYDPEKRVALVVDEWGTWYEVEEGTNPGFLYQQNTMRDALVAAITLDVFNAHSDRVRVANLAQTINVLQAPILTEGAAMILTPTYHVFDLYQGHQDSRLVPTAVETEAYKLGERSMDAIGASSSIGDDGVLHVTMHNRDPRRALPLSVVIRGLSGTIAAGAVSARIVTGKAMNSHNTATDPRNVVVAPFEVKVDGATLAATLPAMSVVAIDVRTR